MSFSFAASGKTKEETIEAVTAEMDKVVQQQPHHAHDKPAVIAAASAYIDLLDGKTEDDTISLSISGSLGWSSSAGEDHKYTGAGLNISARVYNP